MDKEIIIDGVNVAGCIRFVEDDNCCCDLGGDCKGWDNCYYKQLKRLEQENAELKWENEKIKLSNENLRLALKTYKMPEVVKVLTDWRTGELDLRINKYKQTLQEIKSLAEAPKPFIDLSETKTAIEVGYDYAAICNELELRLHKVLDLITKAEEE